MESDNGSLGFKVTLDNSQLAADAARIKAQLQAIGDTGAASGARLDNAFNQARKSANLFGNDIASLQRNILTLASVSTLGRLGKEIISVRGEFQQLGIAFETMLGSKEKSDRLMAEQIAFSQKTPYTLTDVATNTKQLLAMGIAQEKVMQTMKDLGNVAAGVSVPISRVAINYGQVATLGKLQQREIRDFAMAGIPIIDELAKNLGKAKDEIFGMVEAGQIGFPEVEKAFQTMSGEGGKFYNLMEKQNASVTGQISNLTDKWQVMLNAIGKSNEGLIYGGISGLASMVSNYQDIVEVLKVLAVTYGLVKTASIMYSVHESVMAKMDAARAKIIAGKVAALQAEFAIKDAAEAKAKILAAEETSRAAILLKTEQSIAASSAKVTAAKIANAKATQDLAAAELELQITQARNTAAWEAGFMTLKKSQNVKKEMVAVDKAYSTLKKTEVTLDKAITADTVVNERIKSQAVRVSASERIKARIQVRDMERALLIESQAATNKEVAAAAKSSILATMTAGANPYILIAGAVMGLFYALSKLAPVVKTVDEHIADMNKTVESIGKQNETDSLIAKYEELNSITEKSTDQQGELNKTIKTLSTLFPDAITGTDQYGQSVSLSTEKMIALNEQLKLNLKLKTEGDLKTQQASLRTLRDQQAKLLDEVNNGGELKWDAWGFGKHREAFSPEELSKRRAELIDVSAQVDQLAGKVSIVNEELSKMAFVGAESFIKANADKFKKVTEYTRDEAIKTVDKLNDLYKGDGSKNDAAIQKQADDLLNYANGIKTTKEQTEALKVELRKAYEELKRIQSPSYESKTGTPLKDIEDKKAVIKGLEDQLGMHEKEKKAIDELKVAQEALEKAVKSGNRTAIEAAAERVTALENEKRTLEELIDLELQRAWRKQFDGQSMTPMQSKGVAPIVQVGSLKSVQGILYEVTAIDKTGPVWTKVKAQYSELKKFEKKTNEAAAKMQEDLDKEVADKKKQTQQQILEGATQFTNELVDQLGLSEQQTAQMKQMVSMVSSVASGNWIGAVFQAASMVIGTLKEETVSFLDITNEQISKTNDLLSLHSKILSGLSGNDYYKASAAELKKINLELDSYNKKLAEIAVSDSRTHRKIDTSKWEAPQWLSALDNPIFSINGGKEATAAILGQIADLEAKKAALIDEMYQKILGFGVSEVSDSIFKGIEDGLKLGENSLGGFAQSFGDLMKKALMQAIIDSTNTEITTNFLPKVKEFLQNNEVGPNGEKISPREQLLLEGIYSSIVKGGQEQQAATKSITDKYGTSSDSTRTGSSKGIAQASQDSIDETNGRLTAMQGHTFSMSQGVGILVSNSNLILKSVQGIEKNTMSLSRLEAIENNIASVKNGIDTINLKGIMIK